MAKKVIRSAIEAKYLDKVNYINEHRSRLNDPVAYKDSVHMTLGMDCRSAGMYAAILGDGPAAKNYFLEAAEHYYQTILIQNEQKGICQYPHFWEITTSSLLGQDLDNHFAKMIHILKLDPPVYEGVMWHHFFYCAASFIICDDERINKYLTRFNELSSMSKWQKHGSVGFALVFNGIHERNKEKIIAGLNEVFRRFHAQYPRHETIPFCEWGISLINLSRISGFEIDVQKDIDIKYRPFVPEIYGGDGFIETETRPDGDNLLKNELLVEPLYGKSSAIMTVLEHIEEVYWKDHFSHVNLDVEDMPQFQLKRIKTGTYQDFNMYKVIIKFKKKGYYIIIRHQPVGWKNEWQLKLEDTAIFVSVSKGVVKQLFTIQQQQNEDDEAFKVKIKKIDPTGTVDVGCPPKLPPP
jgi:hypothetical protein